MNSSREAIYGALFTLLQSALQPLKFVTISRRSRSWQDVPTEEQPAAFLHQGIQKAVVLPSPAPPTKWELHADFLIYVTAGGDPDASAAPLLNAAVDNIEKLLPIGGPLVQNLGLPGVVEVRINGEVEYAEGNLTGQGIAIVPIRIVAV